MERWLYWLSNNFRRNIVPPTIIEEPKKKGLTLLKQFAVYWDFILDIYKRLEDV